MGRAVPQELSCLSQTEPVYSDGGSPRVCSHIGPFSAPGSTATIYPYTFLLSPEFVEETCSSYHLT